ncbi:hypothetical protein F4810DRAFT_199872 [Camillea tinctor]|nr:hypothetical protein F4810DRAFT_199872 [Camillea tinctor]
MAKKKKRTTTAPPDPVLSSLPGDITSNIYSDFATQLSRNGILDLTHSTPPANLKSLRDCLAESHATSTSLKPTYEDYIDTIRGAVNKETLVAEMLLLFDAHPQKQHRRALNEPFTGFPTDIGFNDGLPAPQPHYLESLRVQDYHPFLIDEHIKCAVPAFHKHNHDHSIVLPHLAGDWAGPGESLGKARLRSAYHGAALVYCRNRALEYTDSSDPLGHARIITFITDGTTLVFFAHWMRSRVECYGEVSEYHQYPIVVINLTGSHAEFKRGRETIRYFQESAGNRSCELRDRLLQQWGRTHSGLWKDKHDDEQGNDLEDIVNDNCDDDDIYTLRNKPKEIVAEVEVEDDDFVIIN